MMPCDRCAAAAEHYHIIVEKDMVTGVEYDSGNGYSRYLNKDEYVVEYREKPKKTLAVHEVEMAILQKSQACL
jgi:hypothetical protein